MHRQNRGPVFCSLSLITIVCAICRLVAGPPATLCTDRSNITVDEAGIELCPQGQELYTAADALHPGQEITYVIFSPFYLFLSGLGFCFVRSISYRNICSWRFPTESYSLGCGASCDSHQTSWLESTHVCGVRQTQRQISQALHCIKSMRGHVCCKHCCIPV